MKKLKLWCISLVFILIFGSCKPTDNSQTKESNITIKLGEFILDTQMSNLNPFATGNALVVIKIIYESLFEYNNKTGELDPILATSYSWNDNKDQLTVTINKSVKWHDDKPFISDDVVYTMNILKENKAFDRYALWEKIDSVESDGDKVIFKTKGIFLSLPRYLSQVLIVPKHIWENEQAKYFVNQNPIGTGPFIYKKYTTGTSVSFEANKNYWAGSPKVEKLLMIMYNSSSNLTLALLKGEIEGAAGGTIAMSSLPKFRQKEYAQIDLYTGVGNFSVVINHENEFLSDVNVRKAMAMAINQTELISKGEYDGVFPTSISWLPDLFGEYVNKKAQGSLKFNLDGAKKVLEGAGYTKSNDGIYQKDGKRLSFTYHSASGAPAQQMEASMIQQWLLRLGVEIKPKIATWPQLIQLAQTGEFDLIQSGISFPPDPYAAINSCFNSSMTSPIGEPTPGLNYFRYRNDKMDSLLSLAIMEADEEKLIQYFYEMQDILAEDYVFLPMYNSSGHIPYYDGKNFTGWQTYNAPVMCNRNLASLVAVKQSN